MDFHLGTMGYAHDDWHGVFYAEGLATRNYLSRYADVFNAVELDTTFYGTPRASTITRWRSLTPPEFQFCPKTPKLITHQLRLRGAAKPMAEFVAAISALGTRLGVILIQLPPDFSASQQSVLDEFLGNLSKPTLYAVEFRHKSWYVPSTTDILAKHGVAWCATEYAPVPREFHRTTDFTYVRWIGDHGRFPYRHDHEIIDQTENLQWWLDQLLAHKSELTEVYGFFNNEYANFSPGSCNKFKELAGLPVTPLQPPQQLSMF